MPLTELQGEIAQHKSSPSLFYHAGLLLNQQKRYAEADGYLRNAVGLDPHDPRLRDAWAEALVRTGRITAAFGELSQFAGTHPGLASGHLMLGKFYLSQDSMRRASEELSRAVTLDPSLAEGWTALAAAQSANGNLAQAVQAAEHAVALRPRDGFVHLGLALLLQKNAQAVRARQVFVETVAMAPRSAAAHREYARCLLDSASPADLRQAESEARRAMALEPNDLASSLVLGSTLLAQNRPSEAVPFLKRTAEASPYDSPSALALMRAFAQLNHRELSAQWERIYWQRFHRAATKQKLITDIERSPHASQPHRQMARMLAEEGDVEGCIRHEAEAVHRAVDSPPALVAAAGNLVETGRAASALPVVQRAIEESPNNPMARETLGDVLLALGQPQEAAEAYTQASRGLPERRKLYQKRLDDEYARRHPGWKPRLTPSQKSGTTRLKGDHHETTN